jgi:hypothetical protein
VGEMELGKSTAAILKYIFEMEMKMKNPRNMEKRRKHLKMPIWSCTHSLVIPNTEYLADHDHRFSEASKKKVELAF